MNSIYGSAILDRRRSMPLYGLGALGLLGLLLVVGCQLATTPSPQTNNPPATETLQIVGAVALGNRVENAEIAAACGPTTSNLVRTNENGAYSLNLTMEGQEAIDGCTNSGIRARASFTVDSMSHTLLAGRPLPSDTSGALTVNVTPISDVAVRQSVGLGSGEARGWIDTPSVVDWTQINGNVNVIGDVLGLSDNLNPVTDTFGTEIGDLIAIYRLEPTKEGVTVSLRNPGGDPNPPAVTIGVSDDGMIQRPTAPADIAALDRLRAAVAVVTITGVRDGYDLAVTAAYSGPPLTDDTAIGVTVGGGRTGALTLAAGNNITLNADTISGTLSFNGLEPDTYTLGATAPDGITATVATPTIEIAAAALAVTRVTMPDIVSSQDAEIDLTLDTAPLRDVEVMVSVAGTTATDTITFATGSSGAALTQTATFTTGSGADLTAAGNYIIEFSVADANNRPLIGLPVGTTTLTVSDSTRPTVTVTPTVTDNDLSVAIAVTDLTLNTEETITLALGGVPEQPTVTLDSDTTAGTALFEDLDPGIYILTAMVAATDTINIVYDGDRQTVTILPEVTITSMLDRDDMDNLIVTATVSDGPIGAADVSLELSVSPGRTPNTATIIIPKATAEGQTVTYPFENLPAGAHTISATVGDSSRDAVRLVASAVTITVLPRVSLTLAPGTTPGTATATAEITYGTIDSPGVDIAAIITGPSPARAEQALPTLSGSSGTQVVFTFLDLRPGVWALDSSTIRTPDEVILNIEPAPVTVAAPQVSLVVSSPTPLYIGTTLTVRVSADAKPYTDTTITVRAAHTDGSVVSTTIPLTPSDYMNQPVTFGDLPTGTYTLTVPTSVPSDAVDTSSARATITVNPVVVEISTTPDRARFTPDAAFSVMARVTTPTTYSGTVMLGLTLTGASNASTTLELTGNSPATPHNFGQLALGSHTLRASGAGIATIADISFTVAIPVVAISPIVIDNDVEVQVAITDGSILPSPVSVQLGLTGAASRTETITLAANIANPYASSTTFTDLPTGSYTLTTNSPSGLDITIFDSLFRVEDGVPTNPTGTWTALSSGTRADLQSVAYGNGHWVAVGLDGSIVTTTDPTTIDPTTIDPADGWTAATSGTTSHQLWDVAYGNGRWVAVSASGGILTATDPAGSWAAGRTSEFLNGVAYGNGRWVAVGLDGVVITATDPTGSWTTAADSGTDFSLEDVAYANGRWVAVGSVNLVTAIDPTGTWTPVNNGISSLLSGVAYSNGTWVAVGTALGNGAIVTATDPTSSWTAAAGSISTPLSGVAYGNGRWVAMGTDGAIFTAADPTATWTAATSNTFNALSGVAYANGRWAIVGGSGDSTIMIPGDLATTITSTPTGDDLAVQVAIVDGATLPSSIAVEMRLTGGRTETKTVTLAANTINPGTSTSFLNLPTGDYTLAAMATGLNITIFDTTFRVKDGMIFITPKPGTINVHPVLIDNDVEIQVAITDGTTLASPVSVQLGLTGAASRTETITLAASMVNPSTSTTFDNLPIGSYTLTAIGTNISIFDGSLSVEATIPTDPAGTWQEMTIDTSRELRDLEYANGIWVAVGARAILTATDPSGPWTAPRSFPSGLKIDFEGVAYGSGTWVAVGVNLRGEGTILTATDPTGVWTQAASTPSIFPYGVGYGDGKWVAVGEDGTIITATNPAGRWTTVASGTSVFLRNVAYANGLWVIVGGAAGNTGVILTAADPTAIWQETTTTIPSGLFDLAYANGRWVATGWKGRNHTATDPSGTWADANSGNITDCTEAGIQCGLWGVAYGNGKWVAVGRSSNPASAPVVITTDPTSTWAESPGSDTPNELYDVVYANGRWVAVGTASRVDPDPHAGGRSLPTGVILTAPE